MNHAFPRAYKEDNPNNCILPIQFIMELSQEVYTQPSIPSSHIVGWSGAFHHLIKDKI
jgi:hypothetical protein